MACGYTEAFFFFGQATQELKNQVIKSAGELVYKLLLALLPHSKEDKSSTPEWTKVLSVESCHVLHVPADSLSVLRFPPTAQKLVLGPLKTPLKTEDIAT